MLDGVAAASGAEATGSVVIIIACGVAICRRAMPALAVVGSGALSAAAASDATGDRPDESVTFDLPLREVACKSNYFAYLTRHKYSSKLLYEITVFMVRGDLLAFQIGHWRRARKAFGRPTGPFARRPLAVKVCVRIHPGGPELDARRALEQRCQGRGLALHLLRCSHAVD